MSRRHDIADTPSVLGRRRLLAASGSAESVGAGLAALPAVAADGVTVPPGRRAIQLRAVHMAGGEAGLPAHQGGQRIEYDGRPQTGPRGGRSLRHPRGAQATPGGPVPRDVPVPRREAGGIRLDQEDLRLLALLAEGMPVSSIARRVAMSDRTIRRRIRAICEQLGMKATVQAIVWAAHRGLV